MNTSGDRDFRFPGLVHGLGHPVRLADEGLDDLALGDGTDDLAVLEDLALAIAGSNTKVGLTTLAQTVDDTSHDGHAQRGVDSLESVSDVVGQGQDVDLAASAGGAGDDLQAAGAQVEGLQDLDADLDLLDRVGRQRDADGVTDALGEQVPEGDRGLDGALEGGPIPPWPRQSGRRTCRADACRGSQH